PGSSSPGRGLDAGGAGVGFDPTAGNGPVLCAAPVWLARRSLDRSTRATPTTVDRRDVLRATAARSGEATTTTAGGPAPQAITTPEFRSNTAELARRPHRRPLGRDAPDTPDPRPGPAPGRPSSDACPTGARSPRSSRPGRHRP